MGTLITFSKWPCNSNSYNGTWEPQVPIFSAKYIFAFKKKKNTGTTKNCQSQANSANNIFHFTSCSGTSMALFRKLLMCNSISNLFMRTVKRAHRWGSLSHREAKGVSCPRSQPSTLSDEPRSISKSCLLGTDLLSLDFPIYQLTVRIWDCALKWLKMGTGWMHVFDQIFMWISGGGEGRRDGIQKKTGFPNFRVVKNCLGASLLAQW